MKIVTLRKNRIIAKIIVTLIVITTVIIVLIQMFYSGIVQCNYPSSKKFPVRGIDISHHQKSIDWDLLQKEKIDFVIIKATEGKDFTDTAFMINFQSAKRSGYKVGAYHFYRLCTDVNLQAEHLLRTTKNLDLDLPLSIDLEFGGNCKTTKSTDEIKKELYIFLESIYLQTQRKPMVYATKEFYDKYLVSGFDDYPIWIRDVYTKPVLADNKTWTMWQYACRGRLDGIKGPVDLNVFNGSREQFNAWVR